MSAPDDRVDGPFGLIGFMVHALDAQHEHRGKHGRKDEQSGNGDPENEVGSHIRALPEPGPRPVLHGHATHWGLPRSRRHQKNIRWNGHGGGGTGLRGARHDRLAVREPAGDSGAPAQHLA